jgi:hypothetical protein
MNERTDSAPANAGGGDTLLNDAQALVTYIMREHEPPPMINREILLVLYDVIREYPSSETSRLDYNSLVDACDRLVSHLDSQWEELTEFNWKLVDAVRRWIRPTEPTSTSTCGEYPVIEPCSARPDSMKGPHVYGKASHKCIWCNATDPQNLYPNGPPRKIAGHDWPPILDEYGIPAPSELPRVGKDIYASAARAILGTATPSPAAQSYVRVTMLEGSSHWLKGRMSMLKLDMLMEKKRLIKDRGNDPTKYATLLAAIESDLVEVGRIMDALS